MPQARLPDINTMYIKFTNEAVNGWKSENYTQCLGALYALNGLLPDEYRVKLLDREEYFKKTEGHIVAKCKRCESEIDKHDLKVYDLLVPSNVSLATGEASSKFWDCPRKGCNYKNELRFTEFEKIMPEEPYFIKVVPKPPERQDGLKDRKYYGEFSVWFWTCLGELQGQMAQFRDDNWTKESDEIPSIAEGLEDIEN